MNITKIIEELESFDSFFAGLSAEDEKRAMQLYEKYVVDFLKQKLTQVIDEMVGDERKKEADNSEAAFSWNMAVVGFNQAISEQRAKAEDLKK